MIQHVKQHRSKDYFKTYVTQERRWFRLDLHPQGGALHGVWIPTECFSADRENIQCRYCDKYVKGYKPGPENVSKMAKRIGHMRSHEAKCKVRKAKSKKGQLELS